ncbi:hypothetical protein [Pararhizobium gei]|uniref:hypothetical protein n=1 Tax=Pararhizobium gei TaxID=1395951 RepID=UPI0023DCC5BD|nr:hypothetical protein [Rhizobium gei]
MDDLDFDPETFGLWPKAPVYDGLRPWRAGSERLQDLAAGAILDRKAEASPQENLRDMLNGMTKELREQMQQFQRLRKLADEKAVEAGEEIDRKLVQADAKASIEAMSVIVRTLEKIDSLQRTIAHDRQMLAEQDFDEAAYEKLQAEFDARIEARADELARERGRQAPGLAAADGAGCADAAGCVPGGGPEPPSSAEPA